MTPRYLIARYEELLAQVGQYDIYWSRPYFTLVWGTKAFQRMRYHHSELHEHAKGHPGIEAWIALGGLDDALFRHGR